MSLSGQRRWAPQEVVTGPGGWLALETVPVEHRQSPRVRIRFRSSFSAPQMAAGEGLVQDLSLGGCRVESPTPVQPGTELELRIVVPEELIPLTVDRAAVQWSTGREFGAAFLSLRPPEQERLHNLVRELGSSSSQSRRA